MRSGIAFFSTIMTMAVVSLLVTLSMDGLFYIQKSERDKRFITQENALFYDLVPFLDKVIKEPMEKLDVLQKEEYIRRLANIPLYVELESLGGGFEIDIEVNEGVPNINSITDPWFKEEFFIPYLREFKIKDPELFSAIFLSNISPSATGSPSYRVTKEQGRDFVGDIKNLSDFMLVLSKYAKLAEDKGVFDLSWGDMVRFDGESGLNMNYISKDVIRALPATLMSYEIDEIARHEDIYTSIESMGIDNLDDIARIQKISPQFQTNNLIISLKANLPNRDVIYKFSYSLKGWKISDMKVYRW